MGSNVVIIYRVLHKKNGAKNGATVAHN